MRKNRSFSIIAVALAMALTLGAAFAVFSLADTVSYQDFESISELNDGIIKPGIVGASAGSSLSLTTVERDGVPTKVASFVTTSGNKDDIRIMATESLSGVETVTLEMDLLMTNNGSSAAYDLEPVKGDIRAAKLQITANRDGYVKLSGGFTGYDSSSDFGSTNIANVGEWFRLALVYTKVGADNDGDGANDIKLDVYVNGATEPVATVTTAFYNPASYADRYYNASDLTALRFMAWGDAVGEILVDNVRIGEYIAPVIPDEPEQTVAPTIISKNVEYSDKFSLMYAVDAETVAGSSVTLNLYYDDPADGAQIQRSYTETEIQTITVNGTDYDVYVFTTQGVAAKHLSDYFYVQAVAGGVAGEVVRYSVIEYMYERISAAIAGTQTVTDNQRALYRIVLDFASMTQQVLINDKTADTSDDVTLAIDYSYVFFPAGNGVIGMTEGETEGYSQGTYEKDTVIYPYGEGVTNWTVVIYDDNAEIKSQTTLANGAALTLDGDVTVLMPAN